MHFQGFHYPAGESVTKPGVVVLNSEYLLLLLFVFFLCKYNSIVVSVVGGCMHAEGGGCFMSGPSGHLQAINRTVTGGTVTGQ